jgi:hypothetical protein
MSTPFKPTRRATPYVGFAGLGISRSTYPLPVVLRHPSRVAVGCVSGSRPTSMAMSRAADVTAVAKGSRAMERNELGRRVRAARSRPMLRRWPCSATLSTDRCCPWGTVRDRGYGHAEGTAGEDHAGSSVAAMVTKLNRRVRLVPGDHSPR